MVLTVVVEVYAKEGAEFEGKIKALLTEAAETYIKDEGTLNWFVMQNPKDSRSWRIVERYESQASVKTHMKNPFFKGFGPAINQLVTKPLVVTPFNEVAAPVKGKL